MMTADSDTSIANNHNNNNASVLKKQPSITETVENNIKSTTAPPDYMTPTSPIKKLPSSPSETTLRGFCI